MGITKNQPTEYDDLADQHRLTITGKKNDLIQLVTVLHTGYHHHDMIPPDRHMISKVVDDLALVLEYDQATEDLETRLDNSDLLTGESLEVDLERVEDE